MRTSSIGFGLTALLLLASCGGGGGTSGGGAPSTGGGPTVLSTAVINGAPAFVNSAQFVVYTFQGDTSPNQSNCTGGCAAAWPPVPPPNVTLASPWASFTRSDGSAQLSYNGKPLYTFTGDSKPDVATGDGVNGFHIARPLAGSGNGVPTSMPGGGGY